MPLNSLSTLYQFVVLIFCVAIVILASVVMKHSISTAIIRYNFPLYGFHIAQQLALPRNESASQSFVDLIF